MYLSAKISLDPEDFHIFRNLIYCYYTVGRIIICQTGGIYRRVGESAQRIEDNKSQPVITKSQATE